MRAKRRWPTPDPRPAGARQRERPDHLAVRTRELHAGSEARVAVHANAILTDHLGTPNAMLDERGELTWSAEIGAWGDLRSVEGDRFACPFRWPGQYEDAETGLYYNRFRYYDPDSRPVREPGSDPTARRSALICLRPRSPQLDRPVWTELRE